MIREELKDDILCGRVKANSADKETIAQKARDVITEAEKLQDHMLQMRKEQALGANRMMEIKGEVTAFLSLLSEADFAAPDPIEAIAQAAVSASDAAVSDDVKPAKKAKAKR